MVATPPNVKISHERQVARANYPADWLTIGNHINLDVADEGDYIEKPVGATHLQTQALNQNIRYIVSVGGTPTSTFGFQLARGAISTVPVPNLGIRVIGEISGANLQGQWIK